MGTCAHVLVLLAATANAHADPGPVTIKGTGITTFELAQKIAQASGCHVMGGGGTPMDLDIDGLYVWDVLAKIEIENNLHTSMMGSSLWIDAHARPNDPSWATDWQRRGPWAVLYQPGQGNGVRFARPGDPPADARAARLSVVGLVEYTIDRVVIDHATVNRKTIAVEPSLPARATHPCERGTVELALHAPDSATKVSLQGHLAISVPAMVERRVEVPIGDDVTDVAIGRLRIHVASLPANAGNRTVHVSWDWMGEGHALAIEIVDEHGVESVARGSGSSSGNSMGSEDRTIAWASGKRFAIIKLPGTTSSKQEIPFRFDNVPIEPPAP